MVKKGEYSKQNFLIPVLGFLIFVIFCAVTVKIYSWIGGYSIFFDGCASPNMLAFNVGLLSLILSGLTFLGTIITPIDGVFDERMFPEYSDGKLVPIGISNAVALYANGWLLTILSLPVFVNFDVSTGTGDSRLFYTASGAIIITLISTAICYKLAGAVDRRNFQRTALLVYGFFTPISMVIAAGQKFFVYISFDLVDLYAATSVATICGSLIWRVLDKRSLKQEEEDKAPTRED